MPSDVEPPFRGLHSAVPSTQGHGCPARGLEGRRVVGEGVVGGGTREVHCTKPEGIPDRAVLTQKREGWRSTSSTASEWRK
jgi:hypothetical protein